MTRTALRTPGYYYVTDDSGQPGSVVLAVDGGDTLLPPHPGTYRVLEAASSLTEAEDIAAAWASA